MFWIAGLPRSRTAWLANLLTTGRSFCFHDGLRGAVTWNQYLVKLNKKQAQGYAYVGDSDSGLLYFQEALAEVRGRYPLVVIRRDPDAVVRSLQRMQTDLSHAVEESVALLDIMLDTMKPQLVIEYDQLESESCCRRIAALCTPMNLWDPERWEMLHMLRVTIDEDKYAFSGTVVPNA